MIDARGNRVPTRYVPPKDKKRDKIVRKYYKRAEKVHADLDKLKTELRTDASAFVEEMKAEHGIVRGGEKGNLTLTSFDGRLRILIAQHDSITFNEQLQLAQDLINEFIQAKASGIDVDLQKLIDDAFYAEKGNIRTSRILSLLRLDIKDERWQKAMKLIRESIQVASSKEYIRFYRKNDKGDFDYLPLDISNV
jgi:FKBP-type peptidyl-prolyl cis-trans isomerase (trigger factor)